MFLQLNSSSGVPLYRQIVQQLEARMVSGQLVAEEQLPSVRDLSAEINVNPLTIFKAYQILEQDGWVEVRRGMGTFVLPLKREISPQECRERLEPAVQHLVAEARALRVGEKELLALVQAAIKK